ncbi:MAG: tetratricopeptide repeat protein [Acidobacteriota bacterium]|nr:tetratricopeptide repeat protein [Acidobacteriota bacterium]
MRELKVFVSAPSDMASEREKVRTVVSALEPLAGELDIKLTLWTWEATAPHTGRPRQRVIDSPKPEACDVFIGILWHRFGPRPTRKAYRPGSGTEEEFQAAFRAREKHGKPRVLTYLCTRSVPLNALDPDQFKRVRRFSEELESRESAYRTFDTSETFERLLLEDLRLVLLEYGGQAGGGPVDVRAFQAYAPPVPDNLPRRAPFFGREREMAYVLRALSPEDRTWGVLVDGIGGIGKTALAVEAAHRCKERGLFDAFVFVSAKQNLLTPSGAQQLSPPARVLGDFFNETARVLGQPDIAGLAGDDKHRALIEALRPARALLVYDNLETLSKEGQEAVADFLRTLPTGSKAIITSRRRGGEGAVWLRLEKLDWEAARAIIESEIAPEPRLANKLRRADEPHLRELYEETGGSPLALMHTLGLLRVRDELTLEGALELLRGSRNQDLQKFIFQEARRELTANDQAALCSLSFFMPSASFEAWADVSTLSRSALEITIDHLSALSLVDMPPGEERYGLHPLTRHFVRDELLADSGLAAETGGRFADYWVSYAKRHAGSGNNYLTFNLLSAEWANLDAAAEWLWQTAQVQSDGVGDERAARALNDLAAKLGNASGPLFFFGRWDQSLLLSARAYEAMVALGEWSNAGWRAYQVFWIHFHRGDNEEAALWTERCTEAWARSGHKREMAMGMRTRARLAIKEGDYERAESLLKTALDIQRDIGSVNAHLFSDLGLVELNRGHYDEAENYYREALALSEKSADREGVAAQYASLGILASRRQRWDEAHDWLEKAHSLGRQLGRQDLLFVTLRHLALVYESEGRYEDALLLAREALAISEKLNSRPHTATRELIERLKAKVGQ